MNTKAIKLLLILLFLVIHPETNGFENGKAGFSISIMGEVNSYKIFSVFILPGTESNITSDSEINISSDKVQIKNMNGKSWSIIAPAQSGAYTIRIANTRSEEIRLNFLVLTPISEKQGEYMNGYRIGHYPQITSQTNPVYHRPGGLFEVTEENKDMFLTPHFKLSQFLCKQESSYPKYIIIRERLLLKLEYLLEKVNREGYEIETFGFISGFRTPYYNKSIKNVSRSRHIYGGAADIYIDQDYDGRMDDLNGDNITDQKDVRIFYNIVEKESECPEYERYKGGLGLYRKNDRHHGFIHVDVRGWKARW